MPPDAVSGQTPDWWNEVLEAPAARWPLLYAAAARRLGPSRQEAGRIELLAYAAGRDHAAFLSLVRDIHRSGDERERCAMLRALPRLPVDEQLTTLAIDACRTSVVRVFEAIACDNPFPAERFPDGAFNQMVLKTVFVGLPLARVLGLSRRRTPELTRMARDYAAERRAASRTIPDDLSLLGGLP